MKRYCIDCGSPTEYTIKKPIFCSNCGNPFEKIAQTPQPIVQKVLEQKRTIANKINNIKPKIENIDDDYDDEDIIDVPKVSNIEVEIDNQKPAKGIKLKDLIGADTSSKKEKIKIKGKKHSRKQILENFSKEAGSLRKNKK